MLRTCPSGCLTVVFVIWIIAYVGLDKLWQRSYADSLWTDSEKRRGEFENTSMWSLIASIHISVHGWKSTLPSKKMQLATCFTKNSIYMPLNNGGYVGKQSQQFQLVLLQINSFCGNENNDNTANAFHNSLPLVILLLLLEEPVHHVWIFEQCTSVLVYLMFL